jgi:glycosyltransferase involved in cell wall biosynthesis
MSISVSVIIPVYNVAEYLPACLDSVLAQTAADIELICVNDCSPDGSREILAGYAARDDRIRLLDHERNMGLAAARNTGLDEAKGAYVFFLDSDDVLSSADSLAALLEIAARDEVDEVVGATLRWDELTGEKQHGYHADYLKEELSSVRFSDFPLLRHNAIACNKLLKRAFLEEHRLRFNQDLRKFEDNDFSWRAHLLARSISLTLKPTYFHRLRSGDRAHSIMQQKERDAEYHVLSAGYMLDFLENMPQFEVFRHYFDRYFFTWCFLDVQEVAGRNPTEQQKSDLLHKYFRVLARVPAASLTESLMPGRYRKGLQLMRQNNFVEAWQVFAVKDFRPDLQKNEAVGSTNGGTGRKALWKS